MTGDKKKNRLQTSFERWKNSEHWAASLSRDIGWVICVVGGIALLLFLISGTWPTVVTIESESMVPNMNVGDLVFIVQKDRFGPLQTYEEGKLSGYKKFNDYGDVIIYKPNGYGDDMFTQIIKNLRGIPGVHPIIHRARMWVGPGEFLEKVENGTIPKELLPVRPEDWAANPGKLPLFLNNTQGGYITKGDHNSVIDEGWDYKTVGIIQPVRDDWIVGKALFTIPIVGLLPLHIRELLIIAIIIMVIHWLYMRRKESKAANETKNPKNTKNKP